MRKGQMLGAIMAMIIGALVIGIGVIILNNSVILPATTSSYTEANETVNFAANNTAYTTSHSIDNMLTVDAVYNSTTAASMYKLGTNQYVFDNDADTILVYTNGSNAVGNKYVTYTYRSNNYYTDAIDRTIVIYITTFLVLTAMIAAVILVLRR